MTLLATAFGPFAGRLENASSLALHELRKTFPALRTRILPVDAVVAPARLKQALRSIRPDGLIMLGEAAGSKTIRLETTAWNELDFRIPDIAGRQFCPRPILRGSAVSLSSTLPLEKIHNQLQATGHAISYSDDPGRYLCNQLFYVALDYLERNSIAIPTGFIHLPLAQDYPTNRSVDALEQIIRAL
ncbi:MAG: pyroglutamyl-peptidase I [Luteolibacter sp.]|uniref:pyroglutamyl-peptidase I n=1 Tax=Luteolibacter sp. TaxID=1962973 RepID=UPI0032644478